MTLDERVDYAVELRKKRKYTVVVEWGFVVKFATKSQNFFVHAVRFRPLLTSIKN